MKNLTYLTLCSTFILATTPIIGMADSQLATQNPHYGEKGWDVDITAGVGSMSNFIYKSEDPDDTDFAFIGVNATYYGEQFYFAANEDDGLLLGYNINKQADSALDIILAPRFSGFDEDDDVLKDLDDRKVDLHTGLRYTKYMGDSLYEIEVSTDISGHHGGSILSATYEKEWQQKNWIFTGSVTAAYVSEKMADYYFGVDNDEATADFSAHKVGGSSFVSAGLKAEYPITENWVFSAAVSHLISDGNISDSSITEDEDQITAVQTSIKYHF